MRGLRGNPALADWLQNAGEVPPGARLLASADSGIVRVDDRRARNSDPPPWAEALERALGDYGLRSEPRRPRAARRAIKRAPD
ncbi:MAG TPA: hypothetical protein PLR35_05195, partial [Burkholderiaceae bacterium]|nr:hypothetical protein [Burkholderiaceae bacterium]